jgi:ribonuclease T2
MRTVHQLVLCSVLIAATAIAEGSRGALLTDRRADFDYFYLVRQWPATFCNEHFCSHRPPKSYAFTVHGLWPQRDDGTWPQFCDPGSDLDLDAIEDMLPELETVWPSWSSDDATFWNHEWTRHGTCAEDVIGGQHDYFKAVLRLHNELNVQAAFESAGIVPSNTRHYAAQQLRSAIEGVYGVVPHITCDQQGELAEVWMCISKELKPIDCVDGPHPRKAAARSPAGVRNGRILISACRNVIIPKLREDTLTPKAVEKLQLQSMQDRAKHKAISTVML